MSAHLQQHLDAGGRSPGVLMVRGGASVRELLEALILIDQAGYATDFTDAISYIP